MGVLGCHGHEAQSMSRRLATMGVRRGQQFTPPIEGRFIRGEEDIADACSYNRKFALATHRVTPDFHRCGHDTKQREKYLRLFKQGSLSWAKRRNPSRK